CLSLQKMVTAASFPHVGMEALTVSPLLQAIHSLFAPITTARSHENWRAVYGSFHIAIRFVVAETFGGGSITIITVNCRKRLAANTCWNRTRSSLTRQWRWMCR